MITVHHLNNSRSQRVLWLLEELGLPYEIVHYRRDPKTSLAPPELKGAHPLGKSPVIVDDAPRWGGPLRIAESGAIVAYLVDAYGQGKYRPPPGTADAVAYDEWLHYAEGSAMLPLLLRLYVGRLGDAGAPLHPRIQSEIDNHLGYVAASLGDRAFLIGDALTGADVQILFVLEAARAMAQLAAYPSLSAYLDRLHARPAFRRALERGGTYDLAR